MISSAVASSIQLGGGSIFGDSGLATILFGTISGGITAELTGEDGALRKCPVDIFSERASMRRESQGAATGLAVSALNHVAHRISVSIQKSKRVVAGIYGALGAENGNGDNPLLEEIVNERGGKMFSSSWPWGNGDQEIIDYLTEGYNNGKYIEIYGYSRGGNAAVRITNLLGERGINVSLLVTFDPHSLTGDLQLTFNNVGVAINFYQQNLTTGIFGQNPFFGQRINSDFINVKNHNATGYYWVNHLNIIEFATKNYNYGFFGF